MSTSSHTHHATAPLTFMFAEDFDDIEGFTVFDDADPEDATNLPTNLPQVSPDLDTLLAQAFADGRAAAVSLADAERREVASQLADSLATQLSASLAQTRALADEAADATARLLLGALAAVLPAACAKHGAGEVAAVAASVLPALHRAPYLAIRVGRDAISSLEEVIGTLDPEMRQRVNLIPTDAITPGDVRITWHDGEAVRDTAALWRAVAATLTSFGLLVDTPTQAG